MTFAAFRYDKPLTSRCKSLIDSKIWLGAESNRRHVDFQSTALPTELPSRLSMKIDTNDLPSATIIDFVLTFSTSSANIRDHETTNS